MNTKILTILSNLEPGFGNLCMKFVQRGDRYNNSTELIKLIIAENTSFFKSMFCILKSYIRSNTPISLLT